MGLGIFPMEVYGYKNYTSKQAVIYITNKRGHISKQNLKVLQSMYKTNYHSHTDEGKEKSKKADKK